MGNAKNWNDDPILYFCIPIEYDGDYMRKVIVAIMLVSFVLSLSGCTTKYITIEQSQKNFSVYQDSLQKIADQYDLKLTAKEDKNIENQDSYKDFIITVSSNSVIEIRVINSAYESKKGVESFSIQYGISDIDSVSDYNIPLFIDLVNSVSGREISADFCTEFRMHLKASIRLKNMVIKN